MPNQPIEAIGYVRLFVFIAHALILRCFQSLMGALCFFIGVAYGAGRVPTNVDSSKPFPDLIPET